MKNDIIRFGYNNVLIPINEKVYWILTFFWVVVSMELFFCLIGWLLWRDVPSTQELLRDFVCIGITALLLFGYFGMCCYIKVDCKQGTLIYKHIFVHKVIPIADIQKIQVKTSKRFGENVDITTKDQTHQLFVREWRRFVELLKEKNDAIIVSEL